MPTPLQIRADGALDFLSLGALVHRLDPGIIPFRKASACAGSTSAAASSTAPPISPTASACARPSPRRWWTIPIGELIAGQVRAMGVTPFYKRFAHDGVHGPNMAAVYSDRGFGVRGPVVFYNRSNEAAARLKPGDFDWNAIFGERRPLVPQRRHLRVALGDDRGSDHRSDDRRRRRTARSSPST